MEGLDSLGLTNNGPGFFPALQRQMERQLLADPEIMRHVLGSPFVQNTLSNASPQLTRQLILSSPQIQQLLQTNSEEVGDMLNNTDVVTQVGGGCVVEVKMVVEGVISRVYGVYVPQRLFHYDHCDNHEAPKLTY